MSKKIIHSLVNLNQIKQTRVSNQLNLLREQQQKIKQQIAFHHEQIEQLFCQRQHFKKKAYGEQLNNQLVRTEDLNKLRFTFMRFETEIIDLHHQQEQLSQQSAELDQQINQVMAQLRKFLIKEEKYMVLSKS